MCNPRPKEGGTEEARSCQSKKDASMGQEIGDGAIQCNTTIDRNFIIIPGHWPCINILIRKKFSFPPKPASKRGIYFKILAGTSSHLKCFLGNEQLPCISAGIERPYSIASGRRISKTTRKNDSISTLPDMTAPSHSQSSIIRRLCPLQAGA